MMFKYLLFFSVLCAALPEDTVYVTESTSQGALQKWLGNLTLSIPIPPLKTSFKIIGITNHVDLRLNLLVCKGIKIDQISSEYKQINQSIRIGLSGIGVHCNIPQFTAKLDGISIGSGEGSAIINGSSLTDELQISGQDGLATKATNLYCNADIKSTLHLDLSSRISSALDNAILHAAQGFINSEIDKVICQQIPSLINTNLTAELDALDDLIRPLLPPECCAPFVPPPIPDGMINWNTSPIVFWIDAILDYLVGADGPLSVNKLVNRITNGSGTLVVDAQSFPTLKFKIQSLGGTQVRIKFNTVAVSGLNTFEEFHFFSVTPHPQVLNTSVSASALNVTVNATVEVVPGNATVTGGNLTEEFLLNIKLDQPNLQLSTVLAMYEKATMEMKMGQFGDMACLADLIYMANFTEISMNFTLGELDLVAVDSGGVEQQLDEAIDDILALFIDGYRTVVPDLINGLLMRPVLRTVNDGLATMIRNISNAGCKQPRAKKGTYANWENGTLHDFFTVFNEAVGVDGPLNINWIMQNLLNADEYGFARIPGTFARFKIQADLVVELRDMVFEGVTSFQQFSVFNAIDNVTLSSVVEWGQRHPVNVSFWIDIAVGTDPANLYTDSIRFEFHLEDFLLLATGVLKVDRGLFANLSVRNMTSPYCIASTINDGRFIDLIGHVNDTHIRLKDGKSPSLQKFEEKLPEFDVLSTQLVNFVFSAGSPFAKNFVNTQAGYYEYAGPYVCANEAVPSRNSNNKEKWYKTKAVVYSVIAFASSIAAIAAVSACWHCCRIFGVNKPAEEVAEENLNAYLRFSTSSGSVDMKEEGKEHTSDRDELPEELFEEGRSFPPWDCLASNAKIPYVFRYGMPIVLAGNIAMFVVSNTSVGAAVKIVVDFGDIGGTLPTLFEFTLANTIRDMWQAKVYPLSLLVAVFSGGWPYLKLLLMQACWLFPINWLPTTRRETLLMFLDALGKWSLIDTYVLALMLVAFHFHIENPQGEIPTKFASLDVVVEPGLGFYMFLAGTILSLLCTHVVLHYHRSSNKSHKLPDGGEREALCNHVFIGDAYGFEPSSRVKCSSFGKFIVTFLLLLAFAMNMAGSIIDSFEFSFKGLSGLVLGDRATTGYSLLSVTSAIPESSGHPDEFGVRWIQAVFYTVSFAVPLFHLVVMLFLWWFPLTPKKQYAVFYFTEILNAWAALDVFVISIIAAILEIRQFAAFLVGDDCDAINKFLEEYMSDYLHGYNTCFTVIATLSEGCWVLFGACLIWLMVSQTVMRTCHKAIHHRLKHVSSKLSLNGARSDSPKRAFEPDEEEERPSRCSWCSIGKSLKRLRLIDHWEAETPLLDRVEDSQRL
mmetsp:Transcript_8330/g.16163  ORF Transcript_8330/g.16163 Transcript_8330/m.16163 type:complete len:1340 (+) Transcript_8330:114-4133(+)